MIDRGDVPRVPPSYSMRTVVPEAIAWWRISHPCGTTTASRGSSNRVRDQHLRRRRGTLEPEPETLDQERISQCPVQSPAIETEVIGQGVQAMIAQFRKAPACQGQRVEDPMIGQAMASPCEFPTQEAGVETGVVGDQHGRVGPAEKREKPGEHISANGAETRSASEIP